MKSSKHHRPPENPRFLHKKSIKFPISFQILIKPSFKIIFCPVKNLNRHFIDMIIVVQFVFHSYKKYSYHNDDMVYIKWKEKISEKSKKFRLRFCLIQKTWFRAWLIKISRFCQSNKVFVVFRMFYL